MQLHALTPTKSSQLLCSTVVHAQTYAPPSSYYSIAALASSLSYTVHTPLPFFERPSIHLGPSKERERVSAVYDSDDANTAMMWLKDDWSCSVSIYYYCAAEGLSWGYNIPSRVQIL